MSNKKKIGIMVFFFISIITYKIYQRPVYGCFEKSKAELKSNGGFAFIEAELKLELGQIWIMTTHKERENIKKAHTLNAMVIDTFVKNCESYLYEVSSTERTKFLYDVILYDLERKKGGISMLKSNDKGVLRIHNPESKMLIDYKRK